MWQSGECAEGDLHIDITHAGRSRREPRRERVLDVRGPLDLQRRTRNAALLPFDEYDHFVSIEIRAFLDLLRSREFPDAKRGLARRRATVRRIDDRDIGVALIAKD